MYIKAAPFVNKMLRGKDTGKGLMLGCAISHERWTVVGKVVHRKSKTLVVDVFVVRPCGKRYKTKQYDI